MLIINPLSFIGDAQSDNLFVRYLMNMFDFLKTPLPSSHTGIFRCSSLQLTTTAALKAEIICKGILLSWPEMGFYLVPQPADVTVSTLFLNAIKIPLFMIHQRFVSASFSCLSLCDLASTTLLSMSRTVGQSVRINVAG